MVSVLERIGRILHRGAHRPYVRDEVVEPIQRTVGTGLVGVGERLAGFVVTPELTLVGECRLQLVRHPFGVFGRLPQLLRRFAQLGRVDRQ
ncbi:hypothetical protein ABZW96_30015 [Nocardia sp. NPDC004168]|uniref:hypothetical protein n=1 Tax=Nocardia sp. NPDC004168 TaxID=3154452 RepID=UPI0033A7CFF3